MERGVIISPYFTYDGHSLHFPGLVGIEPHHLRHYLLYWDKIEYPNNRFIHIASSPEIVALEQAGLLQRTVVELPSFSGDIGSAYIISQAVAAQKLNQCAAGKWTVAQSGPQLVLPSTLSTNVASLEIELFNVLPSPGADVPFDSIIKFKEKRHDELVAFRSYMDTIYLDISSSGDLPRAKTITIEKLERALRDLNNAAEESWATKLLSGFKIELSIPNILDNAVKGAGVAAMMGAPISLGAGLGAVGGVIKVELSTASRVNGLPRELKDFAYICNVQKELKS